jgi:hypothetical protein
MPATRRRPAEDQALFPWTWQSDPSDPAEADDLADDLADDDPEAPPPPPRPAPLAGRVGPVAFVSLWGREVRVQRAQRGAYG